MKTTKSKRKPNPLLNLPNNIKAHILRGVSTKNKAAFKKTSKCAAKFMTRSGLLVGPTEPVLDAATLPIKHPSEATVLSVADGMRTMDMYLGHLHRSMETPFGKHRLTGNAIVGWLIADIQTFRELYKIRKDRLYLTRFSVHKNTDVNSNTDVTNIDEYIPRWDLVARCRDGIYITVSMEMTSPSSVAVTDWTFEAYTLYISSNQLIHVPLPVSLWAQRSFRGFEVAIEPKYMMRSVTDVQAYVKALITFRDAVAQVGRRTESITIMDWTHRVGCSVIFQLISSGRLPGYAIG